MRMAKYIDRDALVEWLKRIPLKDLSDGLGLCRVIMEDDFKKAIKKMPKGIVSDVAPIRHGRWKKEPTDSFGFEPDYICSVCRKYAPDDWHPKYCPNCGAKMDGRSNEE